MNLNVYYFTHLNKGWTVILKKYEAVCTFLIVGHKFKKIIKEIKIAISDFLSWEKQNLPVRVVS